MYMPDQLKFQLKAVMNVDANIKMCLRQNNICKIPLKVFAFVLFAMLFTSPV